MLALRNKVKEEKHFLEIHGRLREDIGMKNVSAQDPMDYAKKLKLRFGDWTYQKDERDIPVVGRRRTWLQICARVAQTTE